MEKTVGIWIRVSTEDQARGESPEHHEKRARYYAEAKGWNVHTVYHLEAVSGKSVMQHPEARRMLKEIKDGSITGIIFSKLARLARNTRELLDFADIFRDCNADLISLQEAIDTSTPAGRLFYTMIAAMAQWEREEIASRVSASVPIRAKMQKPLGGQASFGYRWDKELRKLVLDEKEAPIRKLLFELFLKHKRKKSTAKELNEMGHRTRNGSKFSDTTVDRLIRDTAAMGQYRANYTKSQGGNRNWTLKPPDEWVITSCPAVVDEETWKQCNGILDEQLQKRRKTGPKAKHLLAGYVFCHCGQKMYVFHENNVYACKPCKNRIPSADLDEIYSGELYRFVVSEMDFSSYLERAETTLKEREVLYKGMVSESERIKRRMDDLIRMRLDGELTKEAFGTHHKPLEEQLFQIYGQLPKVQADIDFLKIQHLSSDSVFSEAASLQEKWGTMAFDEKRSVVEAVTESIKIGNDDISFKFAYAPTSFKMAEKGNATSWIHTRQQ